VSVTADDLDVAAATVVAALAGADWHWRGAPLADLA
jgi:hypothetical protein